MSRSVAIVVNILLFKIGWITAVMSAARLMPIVGVTVMTVVILLHLYRSERPQIELLLLLACGALGAIWDSLLVAAGWLSYPSGTVIEYAAPYWIVVMWMLFATTLNTSLRWLRRRYLLAAVCGLTGAPAAYFAGARLDAIELLHFDAAMLALALGWSVLLPLMMRLSEYFDGTPELAAERPPKPRRALR